MQVISVTRDVISAGQRQRALESWAGRDTVIIAIPRAKKGIMAAWKPRNGGGPGGPTRASIPSFGLN